MANLPSCGGRMTVTIKFNNFDHFGKELSKLSQRVENKHLQKATKKALSVAKRTVEDAAPRGEGRRSEISSKFGPLHTNIVVQRKRKPGKNRKGSRLTTKDAPQGAWYELGTKRQPARPWFVPAVLSKQSQISKELALSLTKGIGAEWDRI